MFVETSATRVIDVDPEATVRQVKEALCDAFELRPSSSFSSSFSSSSSTACSNLALRIPGCEDMLSETELLSSTADPSVIEVVIDGAAVQPNEYIADSQVFSVAVSSCGRLCAVGTDSGKVALWDTERAVLKETFSAHNGAVFCLDISSCGRWVVSGAQDRLVAVSSLTGSEVLHGHTMSVTGVSISHCATTVVSASYDRTIRIWSRTSGVCLHVVHGEHRFLEAVCVSPSMLMVASGWERTPRVWSKEGELLHTLVGHGSAVMSVVVTECGDYAVSGGQDRLVKMWSLASGECVHTFEGQAEGIRKVATARTWVAAMSVHEIRVWDLSSGELVHRLEMTCGAKDVALVANRSAMWLFYTDGAKVVVVPVD